MRQVDVGSAADRVERLARRLWKSKLIALDPELKKLRKIRIIMGLSRWLFEAVAHCLVPEPEDKAAAEGLLFSGTMKSEQAKGLRRQSAMIRKKALQLQSQPRQWKTSGVVRPQDRRLESAFQARIETMHQEAKLLKDKSDTLRSEGERMTKEAEERLPKIFLALPCVRYYDRCINLARTQADMEKEFGRGYFIDALAAVES